MPRAKDFKLYTDEELDLYISALEERVRSALDVARHYIVKSSKARDEKQRREYIIKCQQ